MGLVFANGASTGGTPPFVSLANHISDVFTALNIGIDYSQDVVNISGAVREAPIPEPYRALRDRLERSSNTAILLELGGRHREEVVYLVNHCRPVKVAWRRSQGPAWLATMLHGGGMTWGSTTYDPDLNLIYFGTGIPNRLSQGKGV